MLEMNCPRCNKPITYGSTSWLCSYCGASGVFDNIEEE